MPRRPQDPNHSCDINIPATMPGTPITIDASENVRLKVLENRMVPKNTSHLDKPDEFDDFKENDYLYVSNDDGELRKFPIRSITAEKALDYTEAYSLVVEDASQSLIGKTIDQLEAGKFNRLPIRNAETFHLYIYLTEEVNGNRTTTGAFVCIAETTDIEEPIEDPTTHITAVILSAISLGDDFESININGKKAPIINGNIPISIRFNGTEFATNTLNNKLTTELTATINGQEIPIDNQAIAKTIVRINGEDVPMDSTKPGVIDLDIDTRINNARQAEEDRATEAEDAIANDLDEERRVRIENDDILQANIDAEETRAKAAETVLQNNIETEKTRAEAAEISISNALYDETQRSIAKDNALDAKIDKEISDARAAESTLQNNLNNETTRATAVENAINQNLAQSVENLSKIDAALQVNISNEKTRAEAAEKLEKDTRISEDTRVLNTAKEYTDSEIDKLDVALVGDDTKANGQYIKSIKEEDGLVYATKQAFDTVIGSVTENDNAPTTLAVKTYVDNEDQKINDNITLINSTIGLIQSHITDINKKIPEAASFDNQLADKDFVNSSIATNTAMFRGTYNACIDLGLEKADFENHEKVGQKLPDVVVAHFRAVTNGDYVFVAVPEGDTTTELKNNIIKYDRYKVVATREEGSETTILMWVYEYTLNNSGFTSDQWKAINSNMTAEFEAILKSNVADLDAGVAYQIYQKVPKTDEDGNVIKDENDNAVLENKWVSFENDIPCLDESETASEIMAPTVHAVRKYVDEHVVKHLDSDVDAPAGTYFSHIEIKDGELDKDTTTTTTFDSELNKNSNEKNVASSIAVKNYVDALNITVEPGEYLHDITVDDNGQIHSHVDNLITVIATNGTSQKAATTQAVKTYVDGLKKDFNDGDYISSINVDNTSGKIATSTTTFEATISADTKNAPQTGAVKTYVDRLYKDFTDGDYISSITLDNDSNIITNTTTFANAITDGTLNAPQTGVIKQYVDNSITDLNSTTEISDGTYFKKVSIVNGKLQPVGDGDTDSKSIAFATYSTDENSEITDDNVNAPQTKAIKAYVDDQLDDRGVLLAKTSEEVEAFATSENKGRYIKYIGATTTGYEYGRLYYVAGIQENIAQDTATKTTTIPEGAVSSEPIALNLVPTYYTSLGDAPDNCKTAIVAIDEPDSTGKKYTISSETKLTSYYNNAIGIQSDTSEGSTYHNSDQSTEASNVGRSFTGKGMLLGLAVGSKEHSSTIAINNTHTIKLAKNISKATLSFDLALDTQTYGTGNAVNKPASAEFKVLVNDTTVDSSIISANTTLGNWTTTKNTKSVSVELSLIGDDDFRTFTLTPVLSGIKAYNSGNGNGNLGLLWAWGAITNVKVACETAAKAVEPIYATQAELASAIAAHNTTAGREGKTIHADIWTAIESSEGNITSHNTRLNSLEASVNGTEAKDGILELIPTEATSDNQLADKAFVNSSISTATANFLGTWVAAGDGYEPEEGVKKLNIAGVIGEYTEDSTYISEAVYIGLVESRLNNTALSPAPTNNDYIFAAMPEKSETGKPIVRYDRFKCVVSKTGSTETKTWQHEYELNNSGYTATQWAAINSGVSSATVSTVDTISKSYIKAARTEDGPKLVLTDQSGAEIPFEGGKIDIIKVKKPDEQEAQTLEIVNKTVTIEIPKAPLQSIAVKDIVEGEEKTTTLSIVEGQSTVDISGKADKATTLAGYGITDAMTAETTMDKVGTEIGNVITSNDYIEETTYEEFEG